MFGAKKKNERPRRDHSGKSLSQYGLFDVPTSLPGMDPNASPGSDNDSDLEAELAALSGGGGSPKKAKKPGRQPLPQAELDAIVAHTLKDADAVSDEEVDVDEDDPDLLSELNEITGGDEEEVTSPQPPPPSSVNSASSNNTLDVLNSRLRNYESAESNAKSAGETGKARRYGRAIKTLKDLIKQANAGHDVNLSDDTVPPEIGVPSTGGATAVGGGASNEPPPVPARRAPAIPERTPSIPEVTPAPVLPELIERRVEEAKKDIDTELLDMLLERQKEYKVAALRAKKNGDAQTAVRFVKVAKQFEHVIEAVKSGQAVDLSGMPGPPSDEHSAPTPGPQIERNETQKSSDVPTIAVPEAAADLPPEELVTASSVGEALEQRLAVYKDHETKAKEEGNTSKARRYGRIAKQYEQAIKAHKAGKPVAYDELPTPPGYAPIPVEGAGTSGPPASTPAPVVAPRAQPESSSSSSGEGETKPLKPSPSRLSGNHVSTTHQEKQVMILLAKQKQFKAAALAAKRKGEINEAKEFLRQAKGFDKLIEAAQAGLPVDWASIPVSPEAKSQLDNEYDIVMTDECAEGDDADADVLTRLEVQLTKQLKMCLGTRDHHKAMGDVAGTNRFERLALNVTKDLDVIRLAKRTGSGVPKFHYETKDFSIVKSFTELMDNDLELLIVRGINYTSANPKEIDTYVKFDFPFPQDEGFSDRTSTVKDTNNPEYNQTFVIPIQRNSRQCQRVFKRHGIKFEVYSKGCYCGGASDIFSCFSGLFRSDQLIGTTNVKLQPLETQCELHDSFDLLEGRKKVGGKLEVRLRVRHPIVTQQVEQIHEKWLVIDQ